jgi:hypothetical protein
LVQTCFWPSKLWILKMWCNQKGGSRKPAELTRSPTDPGSHTLSIHLRSTGTSPFRTWTIFLPSLIDLLATWRLTNPATHHPTQHTQLWSYITHRCLWGKNTQTSFMDCIHSPRAQALPSNTISYKNRRRCVATLALGSRPRQRDLQGCGPKEARELSQKEARELSQEDARESRQEEARESHHITSMDCDVLYIIGNLLKRRCLKWARIAHSDI